MGSKLKGGTANCGAENTTHCTLFAAVELRGVDPRGVNPREVDPRGVNPDGVDSRRVEPRELFAASIQRIFTDRQFLGSGGAVFFHTVR